MAGGADEWSATMPSVSSGLELSGVESGGDFSSSGYATDDGSWEGEVPSHLAKYWHQRHRLFTRFHEGVLMDDESWYSVTPALSCSWALSNFWTELIARHIALRCRCSVLIDAFCGAGGNAIQFAMTCDRVIAIDIDPNKVAIARNNAQVYGVDDRIEFIVGDAHVLLPIFAGFVDVAFLSPPWGGIDYNQKTPDQCLIEMNAPAILEAALGVTPNVAFLMPRGVTDESLQNTMKSIDLSKAITSVARKYTKYIPFELESNFLHHRRLPKTKTVYLGNLIDRREERKRKLRKLSQ